MFQFVYTQFIIFHLHYIPFNKDGSYPWIKSFPNENLNGVTAWQPVMWSSCMSYLAFWNNKEMIQASELHSKPTVRDLFPKDAAILPKPSLVDNVSAVLPLLICKCPSPFSHSPALPHIVPYTVSWSSNWDLDIVMHSFKECSDISPCGFTQKLLYQLTGVTCLCLTIINGSTWRNSSLFT